MRLLVASAVGLATGLALWVSDSLLEALVFRQTSFSEELLAPTLRETVLRAIAIAVTVLFTLAYLRARAAEKTLVAQKAALSFTQFAVDNSADSIVWVDRSGRLTYANAALSRRLGYSAAELLDMSVTDLNPRCSGPAWKAHWEQLERKKQLCFEDEHRTKSGEKFPVEITSTLLTRDGEEFACGVVRDISERKQLEAARKRSEESLQRAQELAKVGDWERDLATNEVRWSDEMYRIFGMTLGGPMAEYADFLAVVHPDDRERVKEATAAAVREGKTYAADYRAVRPDGTMVDVHATADVVRDEHGKPLRLVGTAQDISERVAAERAIQESEARVRLLLDSTAEGIFGADTEGRLTFINRAGAAMLGYDDPAGLIGKSVHPLIHHTHRDGTPYPASECPGLQVVLGKKTSAHVADDVFWRADGRRVRVEQWARPIFSGGKLAGVVTNFIDVTERRREEESRALLAEAGAVVGSSLDPPATLEAIAELVLPRFADACATFLRDDDGRLAPVSTLAADPGHEEAMRALADRELSALQGGRPSLLSEALETRAPVVQGPNTASTQAAGSPDDGAPQARVPRARMIVPLVARKQVLGALSLARFSARPYDRADRALGEELARRVAASIDNALLLRAAQQALQTRDDFISIASHELRTPLSVLRLQLELVSRRVRDVLLRHRDEAAEAGVQQRVSELMGRADKQIRVLAALSDNLLDVTRIRAGKIDLVLEQVDLAEEARDVVLDLSAQLESSGSTVSIEGVAEALGRWDRARLRQIVTNLVSNAIKYGQGMPIRIEIGCDGAMARLAVHDRGPGLSAEEQGRIFERFERGKSSRAIGGMGLGLFIARRLVLAHGGSIRVAAEPGVGSSFIVELPLAPAAGALLALPPSPFEPAQPS